MIVCRLVALHYILNKYQSRKGGLGGKLSTNMEDCTNIYVWHVTRNIITENIDIVILSWQLWCAVSHNEISVASKEFMSVTNKVHWYPWKHTFWNLKFHKKLSWTHFSCSWINFRLSISQKLPCFVVLFFTQQGCVHSNLLFLLRPELTRPCCWWCGWSSRAARACRALSSRCRDWPPLA